MGTGPHYSGPYIPNIYTVPFAVRRLKAYTAQRPGASRKCRSSRAAGMKAACIVCCILIDWLLPMGDGHIMSKTLRNLTADVRLDPGILKHSFQ